MELGPPLVSIGLPVYNAERYLRRALEALLSQDFTDFELILSDNASEDATEAICREYAARDARIHYVRQAKNQGSLWNFTFVLEQARGQFFMWAAHDDIYAATFISRCFARLQQCPKAVACCSELIFLDTDGNRRQDLVYENIDTDGMPIVERLLALLRRFNWYATYSLVRRDALLKTLPLPSVFGGDVVSLMDLLLLGDIVKVPEPLFYYTIPTKDKSIDQYFAGLGITDQEQRARPYSHLLASLWHRVWTSGLTENEKGAVFIGFISILGTQNPIWRQLVLQENPEWGESASNPEGFSRQLSNLLIAGSGAPSLTPGVPEPPPSLSLGRPSAPRIVIDGVFFQLNNTGIARLWRLILGEWAKEPFGQQVVVLDRGGTLPPLPGIRTRKVPPFRYEAMDLDPYLLEWVCREEQADLFISTYYTVPVGTPSLFLAYDMIPEVMGMNLQEAPWVAKHAAIRHAQGFAAISESAARDLHRYFPEVALANMTVTPLGVNPLFCVSRPEALEAFRRRHEIGKPFVLMVGFRHGYKNGRLLFDALSRRPDPDLEVVCVGGLPELEAEFQNLAPQIRVHLLRLSDEELCLAYGAAVALVYPSLYEGFGLPILEAMACGCPVIAAGASSIPEVGGDAIRMISGQDPEELVEAITAIREPSQRQALVEAGLQRVQQFTWARTAAALKQAILATVQSLGSGRTPADLLKDSLAALRAGRLEEAQGLLLQLLEADPRQEAAYLALSQILEHREDLEPARRILEAGLDQNPGSEPLWEALIVFSASHSPERVCLDAWDALSALPEGGNGVWHELVVQELLQKEAHDEALHLLERGLRSFPEQGELLALRRMHWPDRPELARTTVFCAVWHKDPQRWELARGHQDCLDAQTVPVDRIYVLDGGDVAPAWLKGKVLSFQEPIGIYEAWSHAAAEVQTPYVMNLNLDDRLNHEAVSVLQKALEDGADLVGGDWQICFSQGETDQVGPIQAAGAVPFKPDWPPVPGLTVRLGSGTGERGTYGPATAWRKSLHQDLGPYPSAFADGSPVRVIGDSLWWRRVIGARRKVLRLPYLIGRYHSHPGEQAEFRNPASEEEERLARIGLAQT